MKLTLIDNAKEWYKIPSMQIAVAIIALETLQATVSFMPMEWARYVTVALSFLLPFARLAKSQVKDNK